MFVTCIMQCIQMLSWTSGLPCLHCRPSPCLNRCLDANTSVSQDMLGVSCGSRIMGLPAHISTPKGDQRSNDYSTLVRHDAPEHAYTTPCLPNFGFALCCQGSKTVFIDAWQWDAPLFRNITIHDTAPHLLMDICENVMMMGCAAAALKTHTNSTSDKAEVAL